MKVVFLLDNNEYVEVAPERLQIRQVAPDSPPSVSKSPCPSARKMARLKPTQTAAPSYRQDSARSSTTR